MRSQAPALMPIFRSQHQASLLAWLLLHPSQEYTLSDLARRLGVPLTTLQREAGRLVEAGLLRDRTIGRARLLQANTEHRATTPLTQLLELTFGPLAVIAEEFTALPRAERVLIFGSWAQRYNGTPGPPPGDVDVLVIGRPTRADVYDAADRAQARLGMQVNPTIRTAQQWDDDADPLITQIKSADVVDVMPLREHVAKGFE
ncbi:MAG: MarR family transcriptional regulator [Phycicoccus sp.]